MGWPSRWSHWCGTLCAKYRMSRPHPTPGTGSHGSTLAIFIGGCCVTVSCSHVQRWSTRFSYSMRNWSAPHRLLMRRRALLPARVPRCLGGRISIRLCVTETIVSSGEECSSISYAGSDWTPGPRPPSAIKPAYMVSRCSLTQRRHAHSALTYIVQLPNTDVKATE